MIPTPKTNICRTENKKCECNLSSPPPPFGHIHYDSVISDVITYLILDALPY